MTSLAHRPLRRAFWTLAENVLIRRAEKVAVTAEIDAISHMKRCKIPHPYVIRNVPDLQPTIAPEKLMLRSKFGIPKERVVLFYHGMITVGRGIELVFPSLKQNPDLFFAIAGYGAYEKTLKEMAKTLGVEKQIGWIGSFTSDNLPYLIQDADVGVFLPQRISEGFYQVFPCKLFEYVHAGLPVIVSNFPEMKRYVEETLVGECVDSSNLSDIDRVIRKFINSIEIRKMHKNACLIEKTRTNWENESRMYLDFITE
jgi:glycosyltransferase involved in cell wall biosynthesis